jgi:hypothetical protein
MLRKGVERAVFFDLQRRVDRRSEWTQPLETLDLDSISCLVSSVSSTTESLPWIASSRESFPYHSCLQKLDPNIVNGSDLSSFSSHLNRFAIELQVFTLPFCIQDFMPIS